jgi:hypothetical protein
MRFEIALQGEDAYQQNDLPAPVGQQLALFELARLE